MEPGEIDQVASKVAAKVLQEIDPSMVDPTCRSMLIHFTEHEIGRAHV